MPKSRPEKPSKTARQETQPSVLSGMRQSKDEERRKECQGRFFEMYSPFLYVFFKRKGVSDHDAEDLASDLVARLLKSMKTFHYDPGKGRFRSYLSTVASRVLKEFWADRKKRRTASGVDLGQLVEELPKPLEEQFDLELYREAKHRVRAQVSDRDWNIYVESKRGTPAKEIAAQFGIKRHTVDVAKSRVISRIKAEVRKLEEYGFEET